MPGGKYGPGGKWIHDRAHHILRKNKDLESKGQEGKSTAYALATQQAHRVGKSPKSFRTSSGVQESKQKYSRPKKDYISTADPKTASVEIRAREIVEAWLRKQAAGPPPSIPTPQFPTGLQKVVPNKVPSMSTSKPGKSMAQPYSQVHSQPPAVNTTPFSGVKSAPPPPAIK